MMLYRFIRSLQLKLLHTFIVTLIPFTLLVFVVVTRAAPQSNYPSQSSHPVSNDIELVSFNWETHRRMAPGSDNWPVTWAVNDHQYTSWGDGGGFKGTNGSGRVSLGVAEIRGDVDDYSGSNIFGGFSPKRKGSIDGKSYGILALDNMLYMWVSPGSNAKGYKEARLYFSKNWGESWKAANWAFSRNDGLVFPAFLQYGKNYKQPDGFVYVYFIGLKNRKRLAIHKPGEIYLARVSKSKILDQDGYRFFSGFDQQQAAIWSPHTEKKSPVFEDANGVGWTTSVSHVKAIDRYLLMTEHHKSFKSNLGIFESLTPWGPWHTVYYDKFGQGRIRGSVFYYNLSAKWSDQDKATLVFSGIKENDSWNIVEMHLSSRIK